jgi:hypothetical protein
MSNQIETLADRMIREARAEQSRGWGTPSEIVLGAGRPDDFPGNAWQDRQRADTYTSFMSDLLGAG